MMVWIEDKINEDDLHDTFENPSELFYQGIRAEATRDKYTRTLQKFTCETLEDVLSGTFEERVTDLVNKSRKDPKWALNILLTISRKQKERTKLESDHIDYLNPHSFDNIFKPLKKLFDMNEIPIIWKCVYATFPEQNNSTSSFTRRYTREEIHKMLSFTECNG